MNETIVLLLIGLCAGLFSGVLGVGGGLVVIPMLVGLLGYTQKQAQGTSLGLLLLPIGIFAVINYYKAGLVNVKAVILMIITFVIGSFISSKFAVGLPDHILKKVFAVFLLLYSIKLFMDK